jgi:hypothetical protein
VNVTISESDERRGDRQVRDHLGHAHGNSEDDGTPVGFVSLCGFAFVNSISLTRR